MPQCLLRDGHGRFGLPAVVACRSFVSAVSASGSVAVEPGSAAHSSGTRASSSAGGAEGCDSGQDLGSLLADGPQRRFVFVGGKGGVGKTTTAASLGVRLAKSGRRTLVVSTDPAHSLGDALAVELGGEPKPIPLRDLQERSGGTLHGMEIDPTEVVEDFRRALSIDRLREVLRSGQSGLGTGLLSALAKAGVDLEALVSLLELSPPGIDEAVALARLMQLLGDGEHGDFERVVIDTAPTGHTLRLLAFPQFLHSLIGSLLSVSEQVAGFSPIPRFLGQMVGDDLQQQLRVSKASLERFMVSMGSLNAVFEDVDATSFVVVTIPTHLAVAESRRLLKALEQAQMPARHVVINQCPFVHGETLAKAEAAFSQLVEEQSGRRAGGVAAGESSASKLSGAELDALASTMRRLARQHRDARKQAAALMAEVGTEVAVYETPVFEEELVGVVALDKYAGALRTSR